MDKISSDPSSRVFLDVILIRLQLMAVSLTKDKNWNLLRILRVSDARNWIRTGRSFGVCVCGTPYCTDLPSRVTQPVGLLGRNQSPVRRLIWLWHAASWGRS